MSDKYAKLIKLFVKEWQMNKPKEALLKKYTCVKLTLYNVSYIKTKTYSQKRVSNVL